MRGFTSVKHMVIAVLVVAFLSVLFLWHQSGSNLQDKQEDVKQNYSPQDWPSISQAKYRQFKEYIFPSVESECVLEKPYAFHSQGGEDFFIFSYFFSRPLKCGGTFVEMGAYDGLHLSISLFFERHLNWKGLLIEANPEYYELLVKNRPNATSLGAAAGDCPGGVINFTGEGVFGHLLYEKIDTYFRPGNKPVIQVPCLPLGSLLKRAGLTEIDFFILDVEGSEYSALKTMDWSISVKVWIVEIAHTPPKPIIDIFAEHGYYDSGINFTKECKSISIDPELLVAPKHHCTPAIIFVRKQGL